MGDIAKVDVAVFPDGWDATRDRLFSQWFIYGAPLAGMRTLTPDQSDMAVTLARYAFDAGWRLRSQEQEANPCAGA